MINKDNNKYKNKCCYRYKSSKKLLKICSKNNNKNNKIFNRNFSRKVRNYKAKTLTII